MTCHNMGAYAYVLIYVYVCVCMCMCVYMYVCVLDDLSFHLFHGPTLIALSPIQMDVVTLLDNANSLSNASIHHHPHGAEDDGKDDGKNDVNPWIHYQSFSRLPSNNKDDIHTEMMMMMNDE